MSRVISGIKLAFSIMLLNSVLFCQTPRDLQSFLEKTEEMVEFSGLKEIDRIFVINLDRETKRWSYIQALTDKFELGVNRFSAIYGKEIERRRLKDFYRHCLHKNCTGRNVSPGQIGVFLSHLSILKHAIEKDYDVIWILEDDVAIVEDPKIIDSLVEELEQIDPDWEFLYTDICSRFVRKNGTIEWNSFEENFGNDFDYSLITSKDYEPYKDDDIQSIQHRLGAYSMILSRKGIRKLYSYFINNRMRYAYDVDLNFCEDKHMYQTNRDVVTTYGTFGSSTSFYQ
ncbi:MAG: hypothetical protein S4CHLAM37_13400 [Chlamydiia bacterium]|nr:hypothetical protein [Chlamydiia bacterium]